MPMHPALFFVLDHETRLASQTEILFERINRLAPLRRREPLILTRIDVGLIEIVLAFGAGGDALHLAEGTGHGLGRDPDELHHLYALVLLAVLQMLPPPPAGAVT